MRSTAHTTRIGKRNTVTIPAAMLRELGLKPGDPIVIRRSDNEVILESRSAQVERVYGILKRDDAPVISDEELERVIKEAAEEAAPSRYLRAISSE